MEREGVVGLELAAEGAGEFCTGVDATEEADAMAGIFADDGTGEVLRTATHVYGRQRDIGRRDTGGKSSKNRQRRYSNEGREKIYPTREGEPRTIEVVGGDFFHRCDPGMTSPESPESPLSLSIPGRREPSFPRQQATVGGHSNEVKLLRDLAPGQH